MTEGYHPDILDLQGRQRLPKDISRGFYYDPHDNLFRTLFSFRHTVLPNVFSRPEFWLFFVAHLGIYWADWSGLLRQHESSDEVLYMDWQQMRIVSAVVIFVQVFHTNKVYARYEKLYDATREMLSTLMDIVSTLHVYLRAQGYIQHARLASRYMMASILLFFCVIDEDLTDDQWGMLIQQRFLLLEEKDYLMGFSPHARSIIVLEWCMDVVHQGVVVERKASPNVVNLFSQKVARARALQQMLVDMLNLPIPWQYFHLLHVMVSFLLVLWAYGIGTTKSVFAPVVYFSVLTIFVGLLELTGELADPFGTDEVDFPVSHWLSEYFESSAVLIEQEYQGSWNNWEAVLATEVPLDPNIFFNAEGMGLLEGAQKATEEHNIRLSTSDSLASAQTEETTPLSAAGGFSL